LLLAKQLIYLLEKLVEQIDNDKILINSTIDTVQVIQGVMVCIHWIA
jgi:hypothetical protein